MVGLGLRTSIKLEKESRMPKVLCIDPYRGIRQQMVAIHKSKRKINPWLVQDLLLGETPKKEDRHE